MLPSHSAVRRELEAPFYSWANCRSEQQWGSLPLVTRLERVTKQDRSLVPTQPQSRPGPVFTQDGDGSQCPFVFFLNQVIKTYSVHVTGVKGVGEVARGSMIVSWLGGGGVILTNSPNGKSRQRELGPEPSSTSCLLPDPKM